MPDWILTWAPTIIGVLAAVVALKMIVRFDVNEWLRDRRDQKKEHIRALCPHTDISNDGDKVIIWSTYVSPPGTRAYVCQQCHHRTFDLTAIESNERYWQSHPNDLIKRHTLLQEKVKKLGFNRED